MYFMQKLITLPVIKSNLKITVNDGTNPIADASVTIGSDIQTTNSNGEVNFELDYGDYVATVEATGFNTETSNLSFRSNHKNFTITLTESE